MTMMTARAGVVAVVVAGLMAAACGGEEAPWVGAGGAGGDWVMGGGPTTMPGGITCPAGFAEDSGTLFYVDPVSGDDQAGDGSQQNPWASIQFVVDEKVDCTDATDTPKHSDAPIEAGDTIVLVGAEGHDQDIDISGCFNADTVTIRSATLHEAQIRNVHFRGSAYWRIDGLRFVNGTGGPMIRAEDQDSHGECHHVQIFNSLFTSGNLRTVQDFETHAGTAIWLLHDPEHITVQCNYLSRVGQAMTVSGDNISIVGNLIEFFSLDAIATGGHHNRFIGNVIYDSITLGDGHHDDFFQSHMGSNPDVSSDIEVAYNIFMNRYSDAFPLYMQAATQCLSAFEEGPKTDIRIYNNVCKTDHYHGISWADTNDSVIVNNTVVGGTDMPGMPPGSDGPDRTRLSVEGTGNVVRNNITVVNFAGGDHNLEIAGDEVYDYFTDWDNLDLSLRAAAPAINAGELDQAPADDVMGNARDGTPDIGAYEYVTP
ncbi:MAG: hypothetical protein DRI90_01380 [Deltaproteobacteria bacterium]|nr:MAG: hypothetical protein DRI90_01380 [Deltaproteobacteria bacterium]